MQKFRKTNIYLTETIKHIIKEIKFTDYYSKGFLNFRKKYLKLIRKKEINSDLYYVNFTNNPSLNNLSKSFVENPDHTDPTGLYGYPLKYVLNYPMDIWYGNSMKNLRVIKIKNKPRILNLQNITEDTLINDFRKIYSRGLIDKLIFLYTKKFKYHISSKSPTVRWGFIYIGILQVKFGDDPYSFNLFDDNVETYSSLEQNKTLKKLGYDVVIDTGKSVKTAILNEREPEQILFLDNNFFEIVETFKLHGKDPSEVGASTTIDISTDKSFIRKVASNISSNILGSNLLSEEPVSASMGGWYYFFNQNGETIGVKPVSYTYPNDFSLGFGEKPHKRDKLTNRDAINVKIYSKYGLIEEKISFDDDLNDIYDFIKSSYNILKNKPDPNYTFTPHNFKSFTELKDKERKELILKQKYENDLKYAVGTKKSVQEIINKFNIDFKLPEDEKLLVDLVRLTENFMNLYRFNKPKTIEEFNDIFKLLKRKYNFYIPFLKQYQNIINKNIDKLKEADTYFDFKEILLSL